MAPRAKKMFDVNELEVLADKGYYKADDLKKCLENGITPYVVKQTYPSKTGVREFYPDRFSYDKDKDVYICPAGKMLHRSRVRRVKGKVIGHDYKNSKTCSLCSFKEQCSKSPRGRPVFRYADQDLLDPFDVRVEQNKDKYKLRQMNVEQPFGTIKRSWGAYYFLTRGKLSVTAEMVAHLTWLTT